MSGSTGVLSGINALLYAIYTLGSVAGLILLKSNLGPARDAVRGGSYADPRILLVLAGAALYATSFTVWLAILSRLELSVAYPVAIGLTLICTTAAAILFLGETVSPSRLAGIGIVFAGMWLVTRS